MLEKAPMVELAKDPAPKGTRAFWYKGQGGLSLRAAICPAIGKAKGSILLLPGRTEYIEKYFETARTLCAKGMAVCVVDLRGQGLSDRLLADPLRGHIEDFSDFARDLEHLWPLIDAQMPKPNYLFAHSMGGAVAMDLLRRKNISFAGLACSAPMLGFYGAGGFLRAMVQMASRLGFRSFVPPGLSGGGALDPEAAKVLTSDPVRFERDMQRNKKEPALQLAGPTIGWLHAAVKLHESLQATDGYEQIQIPVYIGCAGREKLVDNEAVFAAVRKMPRAKLEVYEDSLHELFQERDAIRSVFLEKLCDFVS